jgi:hypothetical protein
MKVFLCAVLSCFLSLTVFSQSPEIYTATINNSCPSTITLYSNATYIFESGCEASAQISFGKCTTKKDSIKLVPVNPKTYPVIKNVSANKVPGDSIWVTILDKDDVNMTNKISTGLELSGKGSYMFSTDNTGTKKFVYKRPGGKIVLRTLNKLFNQHFEFTTDTANNFVITLNIPEDWIRSTHAGWGGFGSFTLLKRKDSLVTSTPRLPQRIIFVRK